MQKIVLVEDEAVLRMTFEQFLRDEGYDVETAASYDEARAAVSRGMPDLLITDIILGGKSGVDLLRFLRDDGAEFPVIMITGDPNVETASEALRLGAFDYLPKPVTRNALYRVVRLALNHRALSNERDTYAAKVDQYRAELEAIFNSVSEGVVTVDDALHVQQMNAAAAGLFGVKPENARGIRLGAALPSLPPDARNAVERTIATHKRCEDIRIEERLDGRHDSVVVLNTTPLTTPAGKKQGAVLVFRDVTRLTLLERQVEGVTQYHEIIGKSPRMAAIFELVEDLRETDSTVLIYGESGTGKELVAAALHETSGRHDGPFVRVNCAALSDDILESELFGHVKGAFTGAIRDRIGRFESADRGTILLDEIGDISPRLQLRLLRVLQEREFERVGDSRPIKADVRVIAATNQDLMKKIYAGEFRQDLYYRLNVVRIEIPPLRERREDIPVLIDHFCKKFNTQFKKEIAGLSDEAMDTVMKYPWPGNVRELENSIERAFILCHNTWIGVGHLPAEISNAPGAVTVPAHHRSVYAASDAGSRRDVLLRVLSETDWNVAKSARKLGIARNTLYQQMKTYNLARPGSD